MLSNLNQLIICGAALIENADMILIQLYFLSVKKGNYC